MLQHVDIIGCTTTGKCAPMYWESNGVTCTAFRSGKTHRSSESKPVVGGFAFLLTVFGTGHSSTGNVGRRSGSSFGSPCFGQPRPVG